MNYQFGFQSGMSTEYAVNALLNNIVNTLENKEYGVKKFCTIENLKIFSNP